MFNLIKGLAVVHIDNIYSLGYINPLVTSKHSIKFVRHNLPIPNQPLSSQLQVHLIPQNSLQ